MVLLHKLINYKEKDQKILDQINNKYRKNGIYIVELIILLKLNQIIIILILLILILVKADRIIRK